MQSNPNTPQTLRSRLYHLQTINQMDMWIQLCEGYPLFKKQDNIYKLKFYSLPQRQVAYQVIVDTNIHFQRNPNGIQWTQIKQNQFMAISFKDDYGANAFWQLIQEYKRKYEITVPAAEGILFYFQYKVPDPTKDNLQKFLSQLQQIPQLQRHQRLVSIFLTKRDLLPKLVTVFKQIDQIQDIKRLQLMFNIIKLIFNSSNEELLYELMCNQSFMSVMGALQYDPNFKNNRPKHRQFMRNQSRLLEVVSFTKNPQILNLVIFTYRLQYVKECILFPYLNDYAFNYTNYIIKSNYKKILNQIFNLKKKDFINNLFDLLRIQDVNAFKLLREIFRIAKVIYANDVYVNIAEKDFFEIAIRNIKEYVIIQQEKIQKHKKTQSLTNQNGQSIVSSSQVTNTTSISSKQRKKTPQQIQQIANVSFEILQQFMQFQPQHFRNYCVSQKQKIMKYPTFNFLFDQFQGNNQEIKKKIIKIMKVLIGTQQPDDIKLIAHQKTIINLLNSQQSGRFIQWLQLFSQIVDPYKQFMLTQSFFSNFVVDRIQQLIDILLKYLQKINKNQQIQAITTLKNLVHIYIKTEDKINQILEPKINKIVDYFVFNKGAFGIRVSTYFSIFHPKIYQDLAQKIGNQMQKRLNEYPLMKKYLNILRGYANRTQIQLPTSLKRQSTMEPFKDEQSFDKLQKKVKLD